MLHREQVEIDFLSIRLVLPHAVQKDRHTRRQADDGTHVKPRVLRLSLKGEPKSS